MHTAVRLKSDGCAPGLRRKSVRDEKPATDDSQSPKWTGNHQKPLNALLMHLESALKGLGILPHLADGQTEAKCYAAICCICAVR